MTKQPNYDKAKKNCFKHCDLAKTEDERVFVGIRRIFVNDYECKCFSRDSRRILGQPNQPKTDVRYFLECSRLATGGISFFDADTSLKRFLTVSKKNLRTSEGQWEGSKENICNATQVNTIP